jgi:hypothetical protein
MRRLRSNTPFGQQAKDHYPQRLGALQQSVKIGCLTFPTNNCGKRGMRIPRLKLARVVPLNAVFALVFVLLSCVQPGLFASANATGFHADNGIALSSELRDHHAVDAKHGSHSEALQGDEATDHHGSSTKNDASCEVHCAPIHCVPVDHSGVFPPSIGCPPEINLVVLQPGEPAELNRPPRA